MRTTKSATVGSLSSISLLVVLSACQVATLEMPAEHKEVSGGGNGSISPPDDVQAPAPNTGACFAERYVCDDRLFQRADNGQRFYYCQTVTGLSDYSFALFDLSDIGFTNEIDVNTTIPAAHLVHVGTGDFNCIVDGVGPLNCGGTGKFTVSFKATVSQAARDKLMSHDPTNCEHIQE